MSHGQTTSHIVHVSVFPPGGSGTAGGLVLHKHTWLVVSLELQQPEEQTSTSWADLLVYVHVDFGN